MEKAVNIVAKTVKSWAQIEELGYDIKGSKLRKHVSLFGLIDTICHLRLIFSVCTLKEKQEWFNNIIEDGKIITKAWEMWYGVVPTLYFYYDKKTTTCLTFG